MTDTHNDRILSALAIVLDVTGTKMSDSAIGVMAERLEREDDTAVLRALERCMEECRYRLTLADILDRLPGAARSADAAWAEAVTAGLTLGDERRTIVVHRATFAAFPHSAFAADGDVVAARMAFRGAYPTALAEYGSEVYVSLGHDARAREPALREAVQTGLLTTEEARRHISHFGDRDQPLVEDRRNGAGPKLIGHVLDESDPWVRRNRELAREAVARPELAP